MPLPGADQVLEFLLADDPHRRRPDFRPLRSGRIVVLDAAEELDHVARLQAVAIQRQGDRLVERGAPAAAAAADRPAAGGNRSGCGTVAAAKSRNRPRPRASTGNVAVGVASDVFSRLRDPDERPLVGQHRSRCPKTTAATPGPPRRSRGIRTCRRRQSRTAPTTSWLPGSAGFIGNWSACLVAQAFRRCRRAGFLAVAEPLDHRAILPPFSGRLLLREIRTFVPGSPLTPSFGSGPS